MSGLARLPRRLLVWPLVFALEITLTLTSPLVLAGAAIVSAARRDSRAVRVTTLVLTWMAMEPYAFARILSLRAAGAPSDDWDELVRWFLSVVNSAIRRLLGVRLEMDPQSVPDEDVVAASPLLVLSRHSGPGDPFLLAWLLAVRYRLRLRIVVKASLRVEPSVDMAGEAVGLCFVRSGARRRSTAEIARVAADLGRGQALLIFPEGANYSTERRHTSLRRLREAGEYLKARRAARLRRLLPPRTAGTAAALAAAPAAQVLLVAHTGFGASGRPWWRLPINETVRVRTWLLDAEDVPRDERLVDRWLMDRWEEADGWLVRHQAAPVA